MNFIDDLSLLVRNLDILKAGYFKLDILEAGYFSWIFCAETLEVNTLEAGLKSTSVWRLLYTKMRLLLPFFEFSNAKFSTRLSATLYFISYTTFASNELQPLRV